MRSLFGQFLVLIDLPILGVVIFAFMLNSQVGKFGFLASLGLLACQLGYLQYVTRFSLMGESVFCNDWDYYYETYPPSGKVEVLMIEEASDIVWPGVRKGLMSLWSIPLGLVLWVNVWGFSWVFWLALGFHTIVIPAFLAYGAITIDWFSLNPFLSLLGYRVLYQELLDGREVVILSKGPVYPNQLARRLFGAVYVAVEKPLVV